MEFSIFDEEFLNRIFNMKQKPGYRTNAHVAKEEVRLYSRTDIVKSEEFSERIKRIMDEYRRSQIANAESLDQLFQEEQRSQRWQ